MHALQLQSNSMLLFPEEEMYEYTKLEVVSRGGGGGGGVRDAEKG